MSQFQLDSSTIIKGQLQKKESKLRDFDPKGREGSEKKSKFFIIRTRENHLRGRGFNFKLFWGTLLVKFAYLPPIMNTFLNSETYLELLDKIRQNIHRTIKQN